MKNRARARVIPAAFLLTACGPSFKDLKPTPLPSVNEVKTSFKLLDEVFYSTDDTFKASPQDWLGRVAVVRKSGNGTCDENGQLRWEATYVRGTAVPNEPLGYPLGDKMTDPELRAKSIITYDIAAEVTALSYLSNTLNANVAAEIVLTDFITQRVAVNQKFEDAVSAFKAAHKTDLMDNADVCYVIAVSGYSHKTLTKKLHTKISDKANAGYSGVNINGSFYSSNDSYTLDHLFELSPVVLKRMPGRGTSVVPESPEDRKPTPGDLNYLRGIVKKNPPARIQAVPR